jgi:hypothetical protein
LVVTVSVRVCLTIVPGGVWGQGKVWHRKARPGLLIPLHEHAGHNLLRHPKSRSQIFDGGLAVKVAHRLG